MGLDISYYKNLQRVNMTEDNCPSNHMRLSINTDFPGSNDPFKEGVYTYDAVGGFGVGYMGYTFFREQLAKVSGWPKAISGEYGLEYCSSVWEAYGGPFWELINFSDCEGTIGTVAAKKLLADFYAYYDASIQMEEKYIKLYDRFHEAFLIASQNGAVCFG